MNRNKNVAINLIVTTISQLVSLALGLILPRIILVSWGSEYNGLINSVTTIMNYLVLLEAGINTSTLQALYKTVQNQNRYQTSVIVRSSQRYYHQVSFIYSALILIISLVYPFFINTTIAYWEIVGVIILQGSTGVINFAFRASFQQLLNAEGKYYVIAIVTLITTILTYVSKIIAIIVFGSIVIMQLFGVFVIAIQVTIYAVYFRKNYKWLDKKVEINMSLLENRKYYVVQQLSGLVFNSTDTVLLSVFCGLKVASVYTVYNMVYSALFVLIGILRNSCNFVLGQSFHESKEQFSRTYKVYSAIQVSLGSILSSCSIVLIIGFIKLYTAGIEDINYVNYVAAILFSLNLMLDCSRGASLSAANVAGQAPKTTWRYIVESVSNLFISLLLVKSLGINGVLIGTLSSGLWRSLDSIIYLHKKVLNDNVTKELLFVAVNFIVFSCFAFAGNYFKIPIKNYIDFIIWGFIMLLITIMLFGGIFTLFLRDDLKVFISSIKRNVVK